MGFWSREAHSLAGGKTDSKGIADMAWLMICVLPSNLPRALSSDVPVHN